MFFKREVDTFNAVEWEIGKLYSVRLSLGRRSDDRPLIGRFRGRDNRGGVISNVKGEDWWFSPASFISARRLAPLEELAFVSTEHTRQ